MASDIRTEVRAWLAGNWSPDLTVREWWRRLSDARLVAPTWPAPYGRGLAPSEARSVTTELAAAGVVAPPTGAIGTMLAGPTLLAHGSPDQLERYLPPMLRGEESWCQLFSEPGAGSDLPALATLAVREGSRWSVNGQKVWNSAADVAERGLLLARTDPGRPKREGISYFVIDMTGSGVEVRPLRQMNGEAHFCEVFLTDATVADDDLIGGEHGGWHVARTTLALERAMTAARVPKGLVTVASGQRAGNLDRQVGDVIEEARSHRAPSFTGNAVAARRLIALAREHGLDGDAALRQDLARYFTLTEINRYTMWRASSAARAGHAPGNEASVAKLAISRICSTSSELTFRILGPRGMLAGPDSPYVGSLLTVALAAPGTRIGGGTDEIQRTTIAERALGLPREPETDAGVPWRAIRR